MAAVFSKYSSRVLLGVLGVLVGGFSLFWLAAAQKLGDYLHQPAFNGAAFADYCTTSEIGGFPFRLKLTCGGLKAPLKIGGADLVFTADEARGVASVWAPNHVVLTFSSPVALRSAKGGFGKLRHDGATLDFTIGFGGLIQAAARARALDWRPEAPEAGFALNAQALDLVARPSTHDGVPSLRLEASAEGVTAPALQRLLKDPAPGAFSVSGDLLPLLAPHGDWRAAVEDWRKAKGFARIEKGFWRAGALGAEFDGVLNLDAAHRLAGTVNIYAKGLGPLAARLGLPSGGAGALIASFLGATPQKRQDNLDDDTLALTLRLMQGAAYLGPLQLGALPPLY